MNIKSERLGLKLTEQEKSLVVRLAEAEGGLSQAALIRRLIRNAAETKGLIRYPFLSDNVFGKTQNIQKGEENE